MWITEEVKLVLDATVADASNAVMTVVYNGIAPANASGLLAQSISWIETPRGASIVVSGPAAKYVGTLRYGRRPGKYPPPGVILAWMNVKGIALGEPEQRRRGIAFAIGRKMQQEGNYVYRNKLTPTPIWDDVITRTTEALTTAIVTSILKATAA
jgi:hypothetical protein